MINNFYLSPVLKAGISYVNVRSNGWDSEEYALLMFESGIRTKIYFGGGIMLQANLCYSGLIAGSELVHIMTMGVGLGF
jgi:hypothetical protein